MSIQVSGADVIDLAIETEVRGERFYREAMARAGTPGARELFEYLADEELRHKAIFEELADKVVVTEVAPSILEEALSYIESTVDMAFFRDYSPLQKIPEGTTEVDLLERALAFEKETLLFFTGLRDLVQPENEAIVDGVAREERRHIARIGAMLRERSAR